MEYSRLLSRIRQETEQDNIAQNYANSLIGSPEPLLNVVAAWVDGTESEFEYQGITLSLIRQKEECSYLRALLKMRLLMDSPELAAGYLRWHPVNKDRRR